MHLLTYLLRRALWFACYQTRQSHIRLLPIVLWSNLEHNSYRLQQRPQTTADSSPIYAQNGQAIISSAELRVWGRQRFHLLCRPNNEMKLKQNRIKTVLKRFCFSQNNTLRPWNVLAVSANHCRQRRSGGGTMTVIVPPPDTAGLARNQLMVWPVRDVIVVFFWPGEIKWSSGAIR